MSAVQDNKGKTKADGFCLKVSVRLCVFVCVCVCVCVLIFFSFCNHVTPAGGGELKSPACPWKPGVPPRSSSGLLVTESLRGQVLTQAEGCGNLISWVWHEPLQVEPASPGERPGSLKSQSISRTRR